MSEFPHDDFSKAFLTELLSRIGTAKADQTLKSETLSADIWFEFNPQQREQVEQLGLLGQLMNKDSLIEVFRNPATMVEIRTCQRKLSLWETRLINQAKRHNISLKERDLPALWLIMPTASQVIRAKFAATPTEIPGIYYFPEGQRIGLIVIHQLTTTEETLWLRMLGRNGKQQQAIGEFSQLPTDNQLYASIEEALASYRTNLENRSQLTPEEEALIMKLSEADVKKQQEWKAEGIELTLQAIELLKQGLSNESVSQSTGLPIEKIERIRQQLEI